MPREETAAQVEVPCALGLPALQDRGRSSQTPVATTATAAPTPEADREKQQLASSLFVGLRSQSSAGPCLMGKAEPTPHRFRRKAKGQGSSAGGSDRSCDSASSSHSPSASPLCVASAVENLLCRGPPDSAGSAPLLADTTPPLADSAPPPAESAPHLPCDLPTTDNGPRSTQQDPTEGASENGMAAVDPDAPPADLRDPDKRLRLSARLPGQLSALPRSEITPLCAHGGLALSACCVQAEHSCLFVVFVANTSASAARRFDLRMTSEELEV
ncbi:hypothetical protein CRUP_005413, partial [Coryphaenoides rupestris]